MVCSVYLEDICGDHPLFQEDMYCQVVRVKPNNCGISSESLNVKYQ